MWGNRTFKLEIMKVDHSLLLPLPNLWLSLTMLSYSRRYYPS